jgi:hypothetical protein
MVLYGMEYGMWYGMDEFSVSYAGAVIVLVENETRYK